MDVASFVSQILQHAAAGPHAFFSFFVLFCFQLNFSSFLNCFSSVMPSVLSSKIPQSSVYVVREQLSARVPLPSSHRPCVTVILAEPASKLAAAPFLALLRRTAAAAAAERTRYPIHIRFGTPHPPVSYPFDDACSIHLFSSTVESPVSYVMRKLVIHIHEHINDTLYAQHCTLLPEYTHNIIQGSLPQGQRGDKLSTAAYAFIQNGEN